MFLSLNIEKMFYYIDKSKNTYVANKFLKWKAKAPYIFIFKIWSRYGPRKEVDMNIEKNIKHIHRILNFLSWTQKLVNQLIKVKVFFINYAL